MKKTIISKVIGVLSISCVLSLLDAPIQSDAENVKDLEKQASALQTELSGINQEILDLGNQVADTEEKIAQADGQIEQIQEQLSIAKLNEEERYEDMSLRIKYMYENNTTSWAEFIFSADSFGDFLNNVEFVKNVMDYDRQKLEDLHELQVAIASEEERMQEEKESYMELQEELQTKNAELVAKAKATSTDINGLTSKIATIRQAEAEAAAKKAAQEQAAREKAAQQAAQTQAQAQASAAKPQTAKPQTSVSTSQSSSSTAGTGGYAYSTSGVLTPSKGVVYYDGHRETYYSQRVLPGGGLNIPGRHVASDGTIRDADGYICVASSDLPKGTVVNTSLGPGKVYDSGCASGTIDLYTDW